MVARTWGKKFPVCAEQALWKLNAVNQVGRQEGPPKKKA